MGGFVPVLPGDGKESDSLNPKVKDSADQDRNFGLNFADFELSEDFPDFSAFEEWFDNLSAGSLDFWSSMGGDCESGLTGSGVPVKVDGSEGENIGSLCGGGAVSVKVEESEGENIGSLCGGGVVSVKVEENEGENIGTLFGGGAVSVKLVESREENIGTSCVGSRIIVKVEQYEVGDVNVISERGNGVNDGEAFVEREMARVSLGSRDNELSCGRVDEIGGRSDTVRMSGRYVIDDEVVSVKTELDAGDGVLCDRAVVVGGGVCVKTELASGDGEIPGDSMVGVVVESNEKLDDGQQACVYVPGKDIKDADDEMEEGEIREGNVHAMPVEKDFTESEEDVDDADKMVDWSVDENETNGFEEFSDDENEVIAGPILSKNELKALPPVPSVSVKLEPHHEMVPIGPILSIVELKVVVEGCLKHNPLSEGSILWIAESRSPLGFVDEIFGPVKNPYYLIRYNSKAEIPAGVKEGNLVSSVPEYVSYVLNLKDLHKKGYDLSGKNDEEVSEEEEFSDDEREAEYKRMQRMSKRDTEMNLEKTANRKARKKRDNGRNPNWKPRPSTQPVPTTQSQVQLNENRDRLLTRPASTDIGNSASSPDIPPGFGGSNEVLSFPLQMPSGSNFASPLNPSLLSGLPLQAPTGTVLLNAISNALLLLANDGQFPAQFPAQAAQFPTPASTDIGNSPSSPAIPPGFGENNEVPSFPLQMSSGSNFASPSNPSLLSGLPLQGLTDAVLLNAISNALVFPANNGQFPAQFLAQAAQFPAQPMVPPNQVPFQLAYNANQNILANLVPPGVQLNPFGASSPWPGPIPQNRFNAVGVGVGMSPGGQVDPSNLILFANALGINLSRGQNVQNFNAMAPAPAAAPPTAAMPPPMQSFGQFKPGASSGPEHRPFCRGGGRFSGGRGRGRFN